MAGATPSSSKFLRYAQRSCAEGQSQLCVALDQGYIPQEHFTEFYELARRTRATIGAFIKYLRDDEAKSKQPKTANRRP